MRKLILLFALLGAGLAVGCSDNSSTDSQASGQTSNGQGETSLSVDTEDDSASYSSGDTSISVNKDDGEKNKSK